MRSPSQIRTWTIHSVSPIRSFCCCCICYQNFKIAILHINTLISGSFFKAKYIYAALLRGSHLLAMSSGRPFQTMRSPVGHSPHHSLLSYIQPFSWFLPGHCEHPNHQTLHMTPQDPCGPSGLLTWCADATSQSSQLWARRITQHQSTRHSQPPNTARTQSVFTETGTRR